MGTRILLIGRGLFRDGLAHVLSREPAVSIVGSANTWQEARDMIARVQPDALIIDEGVTTSSHQELRRLLGPDATRLKIIHLSLDENRAIVDDLRQVADMSMTDLLKILHTASDD